MTRKKQICFSLSDDLIQWYQNLSPQTKGHSIRTALRLFVADQQEFDPHLMRVRLKEVDERSETAIQILMKSILAHQDQLDAQAERILMLEAQVSSILNVVTTNQETNFLND